MRVAPLLIAFSTFTQVYASDEWKQFPSQWDIFCNLKDYNLNTKKEQTTETLTQSLKSLVTEAYTLGFERLLKINPHFVSQLLEKVESEKLNAFCRMLDGPLGETTFNPFGRTSVKISSNILSNYISHTEVQQQLKEYIEKNPQDADFLRGSVRPDTISMQIVVHELLHFMRADNISRSIHNDPNKSAVNDIVFACSNSAFPSASSTPSKRDIEDCEVCARARIVNGRNTLSEDAKDIVNAQRVCAQIDSKI